jgi:hypothetical protein
MKTAMIMSIVVLVLGVGCGESFTEEKKKVFGT